MSDQVFTWNPDIDRLFDVVTTKGEYEGSRQKWIYAGGDTAQDLRLMKVQEACEVLPLCVEEKIALRGRVGTSTGFVIQYIARKDCLGLWVQKGSHNRVSYLIEFPSTHYAAAFLMDACAVKYQKGQRNRISYSFAHTE